MGPSVNVFFLFWMVVTQVCSFCKYSLSHTFMIGVLLSLNIYSSVLIVFGKNMLEPYLSSWLLTHVILLVERKVAVMYFSRVILEILKKYTPKCK